MNQFKEHRSVASFAAITVSFAVSLTLLSAAMKTIPMGTAYAVWTGIGTAGGVTAGIIFYKEPCNMRRVVSIIVVLVSAIGLKLTG